MPVLIATITPGVDQMEAVAAIIKDFIPEVQREEGCELYALHRGKDCLVMIEKWADRDALRAHWSSGNLQEMNEQLVGLLAGPPTVHVLEAVPSGEASKGAL